ncbi:MAG: hypothetical protein ACYDC8_12995 [Gammaproteobacteria bacterium]
MSDNPAHVTTFATVRYGRDGDARAWRNGLELLADVESESVVGLRLEWVAGLTGIRTGCALKVYTDAGEGKWALHRRQDVMQEIGAQLHRAGITSFAPPEDARQMIPATD